MKQISTTRLWQSRASGCLCFSLRSTARHTNESAIFDWALQYLTSFPTCRWLMRSSLVLMYDAKPSSIAQLQQPNFSLLSWVLDYIASAPISTSVHLFKKSTDMTRSYESLPFIPVSSSCILAGPNEFILPTRCAQCVHPVYELRLEYHRPIWERMLYAVGQYSNCGPDSPISWHSRPWEEQI